MRLSKRAPAWLAEAESWLLFTGTLSAWGALALGLLAERTAPHVPPAWETLHEHETLAWWTCWIFTALLALRVWSLRTRREPPQLKGFEAGLWAVGLALLLATAFHGGELVYDFGMGVGK